MPEIANPRLEYIIDANLDVDDYLKELRKILRKVDFELTYPKAIFGSKKMAEKYLKKLNLECKIKVVPVEIKICSPQD